MKNESGLSHVPEESRKKMANYVDSVEDEWNKSNDSATHSDDDNIFSALTRTKKGYPAIWTGPVDGGVVLLCRGKSKIWDLSCREKSKIWDLSLKKPIYEDDKRVLVGIEGENEDYEGDLIFQVLLGDVDVNSALRVVNAQRTVSETSKSVERGIERLPKGKAEGLFKRFLNKHPQILHDLKKGVFNSSTFVPNERQYPNVAVFSREHNIPTAYVGGGALPSGCFKGVVVCTKNYDLRKSVQKNSGRSVSFRQALVELGQNDLVFYVTGRLPLERGNFSINVKGVRVGNPWCADKTRELPRDEARCKFFRLLEKHPKVGYAIQRRGGAKPEALTGDVPSGEPNKYQGTVKFFNDRKNYGFISPDRGEKDIFVHRSDIESGTLNEGDHVEFIHAWAKKSLKAKHVKKIEAPRKAGTTKWFDEEKNYGFISPDEGEKDLFVHQSDIESGTLNEGDRVEFETKTSERGLQAVNVTPA